jgi:FMN-dependent oxidoreductase (nitrilotriacetate monooxygenase family)
MKLGWLMHPQGSHPAGWLDPNSPIDGSTSFKNYIQMAQSAERAKLDFIFQADVPAARDGNMTALSRNPTFMNIMEPMTLLSALAGVTSRIGLAGTTSTSYFEPYNLARQYASLDHISGGRAGWNVVTSAHPATGYNFGKDGFEAHAIRYERAREFFEVCAGLWDSWDDDAFTLDRAKAEFFDPDKMHYLNHKGPFYSVRGPLNIARSPQGRPVIFQAGGSAAGRALAAETAEVIFSTDPTIELARAFYTDMKSRLAAFGRTHEDLKICCGVSVAVAPTQSEAEDRFASLQERIHPDVMREMLSNDLEVDLSDVLVDDLVPMERIPAEANQHKSYFEKLTAMLAQEPLTIRQLYHKWSDRGGRRIVGSPKQVADSLEEWFLSGAADGFMLLFPFASGMDDFGSLVVPELQRRDLFRTDYEGLTLRENLGLARPASRYPVKAAQTSKTAAA